MGNSIDLILSWIRDNEGVLSGIVAIGGLIGLIVTATSRLLPKLRGTDGDSTRSSSAASAAAAPEPAIEQQIQYCTTADNTRIAYAITGEGTPIVRTMGWFTHLEAEWSSPLGRGFWQRLSREHQLVRYDGRGIGLSEKTIDFSGETRLQDLEAVVDATDIDRFALVALSEGSRTALRYLAKHPDRVTHLVLYGSAVQKDPAKEKDVGKDFKAQIALIEAGWGKNSHRKFFADLFLGQGASTEEIDYFMEISSRSASPEIAAAYHRSLGEREQGFELAAQVHVPTLIIHPKEDEMVPFRNSLNLAAEIPGARLKPLDGDCHYLMLSTERSQSAVYISAIEEFLRDS